jgi:hypothetical protein
MFGIGPGSLTCKWSPKNGGNSPETKEESEGVGEVVESEEIDEDDRSEGNVSGKREPEKDVEGNDGAEVGAPRHGRRAHAHEKKTDVVHVERVHLWEVRDHPEPNSTHRIHYPNQGEEKSSLVFVNTLEDEETSRP